MRPCAGSAKTRPDATGDHRRKERLRIAWRLRQWRWALSYMSLTSLSAS